MKSWKKKRRGDVDTHLEGAQGGGGVSRVLVLDPRLKGLRSRGEAGGGPTHTLTYFAAGDCVQEGLGNLVGIELDGLIDCMPYYIVENLNDLDFLQRILACGGD